MRGKYILIFLLSAGAFTGVAGHRFYDSAHAIGSIKKGGGAARHPALLDRDRDHYVLIATAGVVPPYHGNARVVLEGDPRFKATFLNSGPLLDLGVHRHPEFREKTYYDLRPKDRVALWVRIKRDRTVVTHQPETSGKDTLGDTPTPPCSQCDPDNRTTTPPATTQAAVAANRPAEPPPARGKSAPQPKQWQQNGTGPRAERNGSWRGENATGGTNKGPAVAFYDTATNERLLTIPIKFIGDTGGAGNGH